MTSLDGLRAFAILAVLFFHMDATLPGGYMGTAVFFVLTGYLITYTLIKEWVKTGRINVWEFWKRRLRRLYPAIIVMVLCTIVLCTIFNHVLLTKMRGDLIPSLLFYSNWYYIFSDIPYFNALGLPSPLTHFWFLAIEVQFYLIWPLLIVLAMKFGTSRKVLRRIILVMAIASAVEMALLFNPDADTSRVYYGTDTRAFSLLIGAWLALAWPMNSFSERRLRNTSSLAVVLMDILGVAALAGLTVIVFLMGSNSLFLYRGGMALASVLTAILIAVLVHPLSVLAKVMSFKPLAWIGKVSFSIYLWHYPILLLMKNVNSASAIPVWYRLIELVVIFAVSALSYYLVEQRTGKGQIEDAFSEIVHRRVRVVDSIYAHAIPIGCLAVLLAASIVGLVVVPATSAVNDADAITSGQDAGGASQQPFSAAAITSSQPSSVTGASGAAGSQTASPEAAPVAPDNTAELSDEQYGGGCLLIGDSVAETCTDYFGEIFPYGHIDAVIGRQLYVGQDVYNDCVSNGYGSSNVVFVLGNNGVYYASQVDTLIDTVGPDNRIFLVTARTPYPLQDINNGLFWDAASEYSNVHIIDWYSVSEGHDEYFDGDGTHLTPTGVKVFIGMIRDALEYYDTL